MKHAFVTLAILLCAASPIQGGPPGEGVDVNARKARLRDDYYRLIDSDPAAADTCRKEHAALVNSDSPPAPFFSFMIGSQWVGGLSPGQPIADSLRDKVPLHEAYRVMEEIGSDIVKLCLSSKELTKQGHDDKGYETIDKAVGHPHFRKVFDGPYRLMLLWAHGGREGWSTKAMTAAQKAELHREIHSLTVYLLTTYRGSGKTFLIGNWEGDWMAGGKSAGDKNDLEESRIQAFGEWLDVRTKAIDDAKAATPHDGVQVYSYLEVNHVNRARTKGRKRLVNTVLPRSRVDFVSVSSYEMQGYGSWPSPRTEATLRPMAVPNLDFIEANLPPRDIPGKRVFIGEIGFTIEEIMKRQKLSQTAAEKEQARMALAQAKVALEWGAPLWLWWSIFNSNDGEDSFGLVDQPTGRRRPLLRELHTYYQWAGRFVEAHERDHGRPPDQEAFRGPATAQLGRQIKRLSADAPKAR